MALLFGRDQLPVFLSFLVCGVLVGVLFDVLKIKRHLFCAPGFIVFIDDLVFMLTCGVIVIFNAFAFNDGNFKWYEAPLMLGGFAVYRLTLSRLVIFCIFAVIDFVKKMLRKLVSPLVRLALKSIKKIQKTVECFRQKQTVHRLKKRISNCYLLVRSKN